MVYLSDDCELFDFDKLAYLSEIEDKILNNKKLDE